VATGDNILRCFSKLDLAGATTLTFAREMKIIMQYRELREKLTSGTIVEMTRAELEAFISDATRVRVTDCTNETTTAMMVDCAKALLSVRCSQEMNDRSITLARLSLFVSLAGLILAGVTLWWSLSR
jgi:hypothetical protein